MSEIKRYHIGSPKEGIFGGIVSNMFEHPDGELVRWVDVRPFVEAAEEHKIMKEQYRKLAISYTDAIKTLRQQNLYQLAENDPPPP